MILAFHCIFGMYGFWLPNDPRGSWSDFVGSWELWRFGDATHTNLRHSQAHVPHDREARQAAKSALKFAAVSLNGSQIAGVGDGFSEAVDQSHYRVYACSIMAEHVHIVIGAHATPIRRIMGHFKGRAAHQLIERKLHPLSAYATAGGAPPPTMWAENGWSVFLDESEGVLEAIKYVERNPVKEGKPVQNWSFVKPYGGRPPNADIYI